MVEISRREHLINIAIDMFAQHGFHATGVDTLLAKAGMSKRTLYTYFRSKEELILAVLRHKDGLARNRLMTNVGRAGSTPEARLLAVYDAAEVWFKRKDFFGCMFINAVGEYGEAESPIRQVCMDYKKLTRAYLLGLCKQLEVAEPEALADQLALLLEGSIVTAQVSRNSQAATTAKTMAKILIEDAGKLARQKKLGGVRDFV